MRIKLYLDEDAMDSDLANALRLRGVDVLTALDAGMIARTDQDHLKFATLRERVLYTFNVADFAALHHVSWRNSKSLRLVNRCAAFCI